MAFANAKWVLEWKWAISCQHTQSISMCCWWCFCILPSHAHGKWRCHIYFVCCGGSSVHTLHWELKCIVVLRSYKHIWSCCYCRCLLPFGLIVIIVHYSKFVLCLASNTHQITFSNAQPREYNSSPLLSSHSYSFGLSFWMHVLGLSVCAAFFWSFFCFE